MNLTQLTQNLCKEISEKTNKQMIGLITKDGNYVQSTREYYIAKNRILNLIKKPFVKIEMQNGEITLTSLSKKYNSLIKEIAKENKYNYKQGKSLFIIPVPKTL